MSKTKIKFFLDQCVPNSVGTMLVELGHEVILLRDQIAPNSPDPLVAAISEMNDAVLVSLDSDFKTLASRAGTGRRRFKTLSRIGLKCREPKAADRIQKAISLIELEWKIAKTNSDPRMIIEIADSQIKTLR